MPEECAALIDGLILVRKAKGWSQEDLSLACGMKQSAIARIESKKTIPTIATFCKIASALDVTLQISAKSITEV